MKSVEIPISEQAKHLKKAIEKGLIDKEEDRLVFFYDFAKIRSKINDYKTLYPKNSLHSIPVKTAPLRGLLSAITNLNVGLESASEIEFELSHLIQNSAEACVINAPVRTPRLIRLLDTIHSRAFIQVNDLQEIEHFESVYAKHKVILRVNPLVNASTESYLQTADLDSKFGQIISDKASILQAFKDYNWLVGLHVHTGSDFTDFSPTIAGIRKTVDLALEIRTQYGKDRMQYINIGGGLSAECDLEAFINQLKEEVPELWELEDIQVITELGRFTYFHSGWCASVVELVKKNDLKNIALSHLGAHTFVREIYASNAPKHPLSVMDQNGNQKSSKIQNYAIAGPLCFGGDYITKSIELPEIEKDDWLILGNTGANALGLYSKHCSQPFPKVILYDSEKETMEIIKEKETSESVIDFW
jgi:diaminopimelate decarboxylase